MTTYRFVQLSDIHFGQERDGELVVHEDVRRMLVVDAKEVAKAGGPANLVLITGDIAYSGKKKEYDIAGQWLDELTKAVECLDTDVRVVPGNHDCDREKLTRLGRNTQRTIRTGTPKSAYADLEDMAKDVEEANPLMPKLGAYREFAAGYGSDFLSTGRPLWEKDLPLAEGITLRLVGMNSVQISDEEDSPGKMILGSTQYILPDDNPNIVHVVLMHHPLEWFMDKAEARQYLRNRVRLMMVGHEHIPGINKTTDEGGNEWLDVYSGATNPPEAGNTYRYAYNWIEVSLQGNQPPHALAVRICPRVWIPERTRFGADTQRLGGKDWAAFDISCPTLKQMKPAERKAASAQLRERAKGNPTSEQEASKDMTPDDEAAFAKLKLLFWRYLDWQQRLKVLVEADALPKTVNRPLPQTMESLALDNAKRQGKLQGIWEAMMQYVPREKQQANPFTNPK